MKKEAVTEMLAQFANEDKAQILRGFFKTGKGQYGEGDIFIGVTMPQIREVVKVCHDKIEHDELAALALSPIHEHRMTALLMMVRIFEKSRRDTATQQSMVTLYTDCMDGINNWDLVDLSAPKLLAPWLRSRDRSMLYELSESGNLWRERIALVTCLGFIREGDFNDILRLAERHLGHTHDLIHKAIGWMLREVGKKDESVMTRFLQEHYHRLPRTSLRYAIERMEPQRRKRWLKGDIY
ncbi:MAG: DNA alkylation repair protein [Rikenellaceae bacterium]|nr:DNA alkylation repair protein [Rikenellaceae bacterium]MDE7134943.1 DNA alkylation repair protein [Rikenellaceae bacterium]MDE7356512.1 DNA alkylation repair protein [Rikenellaceae bacterium]